MPIYEYRCENGHLFEQVRRFSDPPLEACEVCEAPVRKVLHPIAIHFKGSGFHNTDYARAKSKAETNGDGKPSETKAEGTSAKSETASGSTSKTGSESSSSSPPSNGSKD